MSTAPIYRDEAAFPQPAHKFANAEDRDNTLLPAQWGLTKRELLAAMAMQGMLASETEECHYGDLKKLAESAVKHANALLAELAK